MLHVRRREFITCSAARLCRGRSRRDGHYDQLPALAADLVRRKVSVIAATGRLVTAQAATSNIPVVFIAGFDRPGSNGTGISVYTAELGTKRLEMLHKLVPGIAKVAMLVNSGSSSTEIEKEHLEEARALGNAMFPPSKAGSSAQQPRHAQETLSLRGGWPIITPRRRPP